METGDEDEDGVDEGKDAKLKLIRCSLNRPLHFFQL